VQGQGREKYPREGADMHGRKAKKGSCLKRLSGQPKGLPTFNKFSENAITLIVIMARILPP
jgi:hypothetical protein